MMSTIFNYRLDIGKLSASDIRQFKRLQAQFEDGLESQKRREDRLGDKYIGSDEWYNDMDTVYAPYEEALEIYKTVFNQQVNSVLQCNQKP